MFYLGYIYIYIYIYMYVCISYIYYIYKYILYIYHIIYKWSQVIHGTQRAQISQKQDENNIIIYMLSWKQCALPFITTMALWQLMHLGTWCIFLLFFSSIFSASFVIIILSHFTIIKFWISLSLIFITGICAPAIFYNELKCSCKILFSRLLQLDA